MQKTQKYNDTYTIRNASLTAEAEIMALLGDTWGCDSRIIYGNGNMKFVC